MSETSYELFDIVIFCPYRFLEEVKVFFADLLDDYIGLEILWSGRTQRYETGVILVECQGTPPELLQKELGSNTTIIDYAIYPVPTYVERPE